MPQRSIAIAVLTALLFLGPSPLGCVSRAAVLEGRVLAPPAMKGPISINPYPGRAHTAAREEAAKSPPAWQDVVVYLRGEVPGPASVRSAPHELAQKDMKFVPRVLPILVGERVVFPNFDPFYHNVFSYSPARRFDLGKYAEGRSDDMVFPVPGEIRIFCDIHSEMNAVILVLENPFFAQPDETGHFRIEDVPPGRYDLVVWHPDHAEQVRAVELPSEATTELVLGF